MKNKITNLTKAETQLLLEALSELYPSMKEDLIEILQESTISKIKDTFKVQYKSGYTDYFKLTKKLQHTATVIFK